MSSCLTQARGLKYELPVRRRGLRSSCLTQARGLKCPGARRRQPLPVVPHAGTWIEIARWRRAGLPRRSCLTQARGLKSLPDLLVSRPGPSCLTQARGLKWCTPLSTPRCHVVPHAGTWIEIRTRRRSPKGTCVVPHAGTWIEIADMESTEEVTDSRASRRHVD